MGIDWTTQLVDQLEWHWQGLVRPKLDGLTDEEYFWEPAAGSQESSSSWSVRPRGTSGAPVQAGSGEFTIDFAFPPPEPPPFTTIAWRLGHIIVGVFGARAASHFGGPAVGYDDFAYAGTAEEALRQLDETHDAWVTGVRGLDADGLARAVGPAEGPFAEHPMAALVLHIHREAIHHGAEILLLRDLFRAKRM
ncbi:DinB family protein [Pseudonocardia xinjiangensis]|uniref:DinB family protein n=1 Tax=Pseudonocardia xinjiangensis TaxID=75289 RepID=A0ABX1RMF8_9PSEU|nr:DinB family protein [Pseudonocardia xinjiangensis]NMH81157.1 DinB family protein [Pseudonocardia xinjiangensis]